MTDPASDAERRVVTVRPSVAKHAVSFSLIAFLMALPSFCEYSNKLLLDPNSDMRMSLPPADNLPELAALSWRPATSAVVSRLGSMPTWASLTYEIVLGLIVAYAVLRLLNPTFRITAGIGWNRTIFTKTYMYTPPAVKAFLIAITAAVPLLLASYGVVRLLHARAGLPVALVIVGASVWFLFSRTGVAGDYDSGNYELPRGRQLRGDLLLRGALAGLVAWGVVGALGVVDVRRVFSCWHAMGGVGEAQWWPVAAIALAPRAVMGLAAGGLLATLAPSGIPRRERVRAGTPWAVVLAALALLGGATLDHTLQQRFDFLRRRGDDRAAHLARVAGVALRSGQTRTLTLLGDAGKPVPLKVALDSSAGVSATADAAQRIDRFLRRRGYRTALARPACSTLLEAACLRMDPDALLRTLYTVVTRTYDTGYVPLIMQQLSKCARTPQATRCADEVADERVFHYTTRNAQAQLGLLYARLGEARKARAWLTRAGVPDSRIDEALTDRIFYTAGEVAGVLTLDGAAVAGARVGLAPTPVADGFAAAQSRGPIAPFFLREVVAGATTDRAGRFILTHLPGGAYRLLIDLPSGATPQSASRVDVIVVAQEHPRVDLGTIALKSR